MRFINPTPFRLAPIAARVPFPGHSLTLVVKGTFDLVPGGVVKPIEEQPFPTADAFYPDDKTETGSVRYPSDFAPLKAKADLMLVGHCHAPKGEPMVRLGVGFGVGSYRADLMVHGDRTWKPGLLRTGLSEPTPFTSLDLRYEHALGRRGKKSLNPVGRGTHSIEGDDGTSVVPAPNIEDPEHPITSPSARLDPAGFGPVNAAWHSRTRHLGTYKKAWLEHRWPWYPEDFDWAYFNAAPEKMQVEYLRGDEQLTLVHLHPDHPELQTTLPELRVRCFVRDHHNELREVRMNLDTLWVDTDAHQVTLLWRGWTQTESEDFEEQFTDAFVMTEPLADAPLSADACRQRFQAAVLALDGAAEPPPAPAVPKATPVADANVDDEKDTSDTDTDTNAESSDPEIKVPTDEEIDAKLKEDIRKAYIAAGLDPDNPPPPTPEQKAEQKRLLKEWGFNEDGTPLEPDNADETKDEDDAADAALTRDTVQQRYDARDPLTDLDLSGLDLSGLDLQGADFSRSNLTGTFFSSANLNACVFRDTAVTNARFDGANLELAILDGARGQRVIFDGANLTHAHFADADFSDGSFHKSILAQAVGTGATLSRANLRDVTAPAVSLVESDLSDSCLAGADLTTSDLSRCTLDRTDFTGAILEDAAIEDAHGEKAVFDNANLTKFRASGQTRIPGAKFHEAFGEDSVWETALLDGADFSYARLPSATFNKASLKDANMFAADLRYGKFRKADLTGAKLVRMNLFEASLEKANLTRADLSGSSLYGAETLDAVLEGTTGENVNVKATKLAGR